mmetsp:Transcript_27890/g.71609  ORF Transcript_27890/g.71609 Transcript_27890/m.71609 type:complete len:166 (-) Transcript_27890:240-737(-)
MPTCTSGDPSELELELDFDLGFALLFDALRLRFASLVSLRDLERFLPLLAPFFEAARDDGEDGDWERVRFFASSLAAFASPTFSFAFAFAFAFPFEAADDDDELRERLAAFFPRARDFDLDFGLLAARERDLDFAFFARERERDLGLSLPLAFLFDSRGGDCQAK